MSSCFFLPYGATGARVRSAMAAALLRHCSHPSHVESVAWIAERKTLLKHSTFLFLAPRRLRLVCAQPLRVTPLSRRGFVFRASVSWPSPSSSPCLSRFCCSTIGDWDASRRTAMTVASSDRALALFKLVPRNSALGAFRRQRDHHRPHPTQCGALGSVAALPLGQRAQQCYLFRSLSLHAEGIWPSRLAVFYPHPEGSLALWKVMAAALVILLISALVWRERKFGYLPVGWLWYLGTLVPVIGVVQVGRQAMADRYAYISLLGLIVMAVWSAADSYRGFECLANPRFAWRSSRTLPLRPPFPTCEIALSAPALLCSRTRFKSPRTTALPKITSVVAILRWAGSMKLCRITPPPFA